MKRRPKNPAWDELKEMFPMLLTVNGLILIGIAVYGLCEGVTWRSFTGLLLGNLLFAGNFILTGASAVRTVSKASAKKGQLSANLSYGARYIGLFLILAAGLTLKVIDLIPAFLPLFIPKLHYSVKYIFFGRSIDEAEDTTEGS